MDTQSAGNFLAAVNALLNLGAAICLLTGFVFIRRGNAARHRNFMVTAASASALFLVLYVVRFSLTGTHTFAGEGAARAIYLGILFSHMVLAVIVLPLVVRLFFLAGRNRFREHARLARRVFPVWLYVSMTGLVVYVLLYQVYGYVE